MTPQPVIDIPTFEDLKETMGADFIAEIIAAYCDETPRLLSLLQDALAKKDSETFRRAAHSIKSTSNSLGALQYAALARELEMMGKEGQLDDAPAKVKSLVTGYDDIVRALEELNHDR